jgi:hypothetical protein
MRFSVTVAYHPRWLLLVASGPATLADLCGLASLGATVCSRGALGRVLVDLRQAQPQLSFTDHLQLGSHFAEAFRDVAKVATVVAPKDRVGTSEKAAQKSGLRLRTFMDVAEAEDWLQA